MTSPEPELPPGALAGLRAVLGEAQRLGHVGGADVDAHLRQALDFAAVVSHEPAGAVLDLGSGGGLPGLVLAARWPSVPLALLDGSEGRAHFLRWAVEELDLTDRVRVLAGRAEALAHEPSLRQQFSLVVVRSFGPPAVVAECGAPFLCVGGSIIVSEPPDSDGSRWAHDEGLAGFGLRRTDFAVAGDHRFQVLELVEPCASNVPRRTGVPAKRPRF